MNHSFKSMLTTFELTFGEQFWHNVIIVVSSHGNMNSEDHSGAEGWKRGVRELCPKSAEARLETVVLDVKTKDPAIFKNSAQKVWKLLSDMESFECKDLSAVMTELDQKNAKLNEVLEELARLRSIVGEKVVIFFQARARSAQARRTCALRALGLLLADGTPTVGGGKTF